MPRVYDQSQTEYNLTNEVGRGGEAVVYDVPGQPDKVAKIYTARPVSPERQSKLKAMVANPPTSTTGTAVVWPQRLAVDGKAEIVGYFMPKLPADGKELQAIFTPSSRQRAGVNIDLKHLTLIAANLASAVSVVHDNAQSQVITSQRVIGDMNESNVYATYDCRVQIIDADSFQIGSYRCPVGKPEYTPPELQGKHFPSVQRTPNHDAFGLAVMIFRLLTDGEHPFVGSKNATGADDIGKRIENHQYPLYDRDPRATQFNIPPRYWSARRSLPSNVRDAFAQAFNDSGRPRPTAKEWADLLYAGHKTMTHCPNGHTTFAPPAACRECIAAGISTAAPQQATNPPTPNPTPNPNASRRSARQTQQSPQPSPAPTTRSPRSTKQRQRQTQKRPNQRSAIPTLGRLWSKAVKHPLPTAITIGVAALTLHLIFRGASLLEIAIAPIVGLICWWWFTRK